VAPSVPQSVLTAPEGVVRRPQVADFRKRCTAFTDQDLEPPESLFRWSVEHHRQFWRTLLDWADVAWEGSADVVCTSDDVEHAVFFPDVRLNYAENLLRPLPGVDDDAAALTAVRRDGSVEHLSRAELRDRVGGVATGLAGDGVAVGDRVVVVAANNASAIVAALGVIALGAAVSLAMPDMGPTALLGRFDQVEPVVLVLDRTGFGGWAGTAGDTLSTVVEGLPSLHRVVVLDDQPLPDLGAVPVSRSSPATVPPVGEPVRWPRLPFNQPAFVMFTSGTTGPPKAMLHGAGGTLLEHVKEHRLHIDLRPGDTFHHATTTAWMVWNRQLSALAVGARIVVDERPTSGPEMPWRLVQEQGITVLGASPAFLQLCQDTGYRPVDEVDLAGLRAVVSTGSVLHDWQFDWFADAVGSLPLQSVSGGTDILGAFVLGHPELPVRRGRFQTRSLGLDVAAVDADGTELIDAVGELVCRNPFPSRPVGFLADPDGRRYHEAYFAEHPGMWTHGDVIEFDAEGMARMHGRSDGVLNVNGVRIGSSEIYAVLRGVPQVAAAMAVEHGEPGRPGRSQLTLLVVLRSPAALDDDLARYIRARLRAEASPAHVPSLVLAVGALPMTHNGKHSERAARDVLNGDPVSNLAALRNPDCLPGIAAAAAGAAAAEAAAAAEVAEPVRGADGSGGDVHAVVAATFAQSLGAPVEDDVNFFDAGGTSRESIRLVRQLRIRLGIDVPMSAFLADPSVQGLTAALGTVTGTRPTVELLVSGDDQQPPLFLVHGTFGDVDDYQIVIETLDVPGPVHGLRGRLTHPDGTSRSLCELAATHAETLDAFQPSGPIRLAGYSFGGLLAFEIARQLVERGREVGFLGLIDVRPPTASLTRLQRSLKQLAGALTAAFHVERRTLSSLLLDRLRPHRATAYFAGPHGRARMAYDAYRWGRYDGPVTFFRAARRVPVLTHQLYAWRRVVPVLEVVDTLGMHYDMVDRVNAGTLAAHLSAAFRASLRD